MQKIKFDNFSPYIRKAGEQGKAAWKNRARRIYDYELMYCTEGIAYLRIKGKEFTLKQGCFIIIEPNIPHSFWLDEENPAQIKWVHFDYEYRQDVHLLDIIRSWSFNTELPEKNYIREQYIFENGIEMTSMLEVKNRMEFEYHLEQILIAFKNHKFTWQLEAKANFILLLSMVIEQLTNGAKDINISQEQLVSKIELFINKNYRKNITRTEIANYFGYNQDYIGKIFKKYVNMPITTYIHKVKIEKAQQLLAQTDLSIRNIAELVGYGDVYYFSNTMKKITGDSPSAYRNKARNNNLGDCKM